MRIRRARHHQIVWRQQTIATVPNSPISVRVLHGRHKPIVWKQKPLAGTQGGNASESATLADAVSATYVGHVSTAESVTLSETDAYPVTTFGQTINRGRNPPIVWRQRESVATGTSYSGNFTDALVVVDTPAANQAFASVSMLEALAPADTSIPVGGSSQKSVVEAETISDSMATVWAFATAVNEFLAPVDSADGQGGSPVQTNKGAGDYPRKKRITRKVGDKVIEYPSVRAATDAIQRDRLVEEAEEEARRKQDDDDIAFLLANL